MLNESHNAETSGAISTDAIGELESSAALGNLPEWQRCQFSAQCVGVTGCHDQAIELL
jgi:hypothetical protein